MGIAKKRFTSRTVRAWGFDTFTKNLIEAYQNRIIDTETMERCNVVLLS